MNFVNTEININIQNINFGNTINIDIHFNFGSQVNPNPGRNRLILIDKGVGIL